MGDTEIAAARRALGGRLARFRVAAGFSQPQLAPLLGYGRSTVANAETGRRTAAREFWQRCDHVLATGGVLTRQYGQLARLLQAERDAAAQLAQAERQARVQQLQERPYTSWQHGQPCTPALTELTLMCDRWDESASSDLADLLDEAAPAVAAPTMARLVHEWLVTEPPQVVELKAGRRIGAELVARVERRVVQLRHLDDFVGGRDLHQLVERELGLTGQLLRDASYTDVLGRRLFAAIGELCQLAGWVSADAGQYDRAAHHFAVGVKAAHLTGDRPLAANLISTLAYQVSNVGSPPDAVLLAQTAASGAGSHATSTTQALLLERVAYAHARAGHARHAEQALLAVEQSYDRRRPSDDPEWVYWLDEDEIQIMAARCYVELGQAARAIPLLTDVLARFDERRAREAALYTSWLAQAHLQVGDIDQAAALACRTAELTARTTSARSDGRVGLLQRALAPHDKVSAVRDFLELARTLTRL